VGFAGGADVVLVGGSEEGAEVEEGAAVLATSLAAGTASVTGGAVVSGVGLAAANAAAAPARSRCCASASLRYQTGGSVGRYAGLCLTGKLGGQHSSPTHGSAASARCGCFQLISN